MVSGKKVVLLVAEAVTLAHYGRVATLARALPASAYRVIVAADPRYRALDGIAGVDFQPVRTIPSARFARALDRGRPLYDAPTLMRYVDDDLALIDAVKPDLVVGDFRLSLAVSAPLRKLPYAAVVNAYWSPHADIAYPVPELPFTRLVGLGLGQRLFDLLRPSAFALHARPLNAVRRRHGLSPLGHDLRTAYTWADYTLYADVPGLVGMRNVPDNHRFLGPVPWSTRVPLPAWWDDLPHDVPLVFVSMGSSGRAGLLPMVTEALARFPVNVVVATAGGTTLRSVPRNVFVADYLPIDAAVARAVLVVGNGGSLSAYQALAAGVPVLGMCSNMDQLLNMHALQQRGAGIALRAGRLNPARVRAAAAALLAQPAYREAARKIGEEVLRHDAGARFRTIVAEIVGRPETAVAAATARSETDAADG